LHDINDIIQLKIASVGFACCRNLDTVMP